MSTRVVRRALTALVILSAGCGRGRPSPTPAPVAAPEGISRAEVESLWARAIARYTSGSWGKAATLFERVALEVPAGDTLAVAARFRLAECYFAQGSQLQSAREFRRVSDDTPTSPYAPNALLRAGDAYADLWRRPELDPTYGQTALATYQELLNRYPESGAAPRARQKISQLEELFARKEYRSALYYFRLKAWDSAILYLKDIAATYPRAAVTPQALLTLVDSYRRVGYTEDVQETCGYIRRFHPTVEGLDAACPSRRGPDAHPDAEPRRAVIGLFGGSFDPIHHGHLLVAQAVLEALDLTELRFMPARQQPFKAGRHSASAADRARMVGLAIAGTPRFGLEPIELEREGPSYTVDTLRALAAKDPGQRFAVLVGADAARELPQWREAAALPALAEWVVFARAGGDTPSLPWPATIVTVPALEISATIIRERVATGRPIRYWVPDPVAEFIHRAGLYLADAQEPPH